MKKIGVLLSMEPYGGGAFQYNQAILEALDNLSKEFYEIHAFFTNEAWEEYLNRYSFLIKKIRPDIRENNFISKLLRRVLRLMGKLEFHYCSFFHYIDSFVRNFNGMDLMIFPAQECYASLWKGKSVSVIHDLMHRYETFPEVCEDGEFASREYRYKNICEASRLIFVDSEVGRKQVIECYGDKYSKKLRVLPFTPPKYLFEDLTNDVVVNLPKKFIFYPAQFWEHKNHKGLIKAVRLLKDKGVEVKLVFVGSKKNGYDEAMRMIDQLGLKNNISVLGYVDDAIMQMLYRRARAMIMASFMGPTNIPPLEGMAMGCPVAVADVYAMPWQVGKAGLTFNPHNIEELAETLELLWTDDDLCRRLSEKGYEQISNFTQDKFNKRFTAYITEIFEDSVRGIECN